MIKRLLLVALASSWAACSMFEERASYTGPDDYAYTLSVSCFCIVTGPIRITVENGVLVDAVALDPSFLQENPNADAEIRERAITLVELVDRVRDAQRTADGFEADYDPTYGFPVVASIDYDKRATDDEVTYRVRDYTPL